MNTNVAKPRKVAIIGASGAYGTGILARAEEIGIEAVVVTRSPHKFKNVKPTTTVVETQLDEEDEIDRRRLPAATASSPRSATTERSARRPTTSRTSGAAMKAAGVTKYIGMGSGPMMMPGETLGVSSAPSTPC